MEQAFNFYRVVLQEEKNLVFLSSPPVISFVRNFLRGKTSSKEKRFIGLVDSSEDDLPLYWGREITPQGYCSCGSGSTPGGITTFAFSFFSSPLGKGTGGNNYGILAQSARALFLPFFPTEIYHHYFWQRSALLYLPLIQP